MIDARRVLPPPASQLKKRKAVECPAHVDGNTSTKRTKYSEPGGLIPGWKQSARILPHVANKRPQAVDLVDDDDDFIEGEFDRGEEPDTLDAVRASKPSTVRIESKLVSDLDL